MGGREGEGRRREEREGGKESGVRVAEEEVDGAFWGLWGLWGHGDCVEGELFIYADVYADVLLYNTKFGLYA